jgi:4-amino-4-deoxy-L-arabinose transferase-like glycosyltransferase
VENQGKDIVDLRSNMNTGCQSVNASLTTLSNELRSNSKTQWPVIWAAAGVCFTVLATGGAFFYNSLSKGQDRLDAAVMKNSELPQASVSKLAETTQQTFTLLADKVVTQKELEWRTARGQEDRARMEANVADIRSGLVPRAEHERVWQNYTNKDQDLQRQVDELKQAQGSVYGAREVIMDLRERLDRVERQRLAGQP